MRLLPAAAAVSLLLALGGLCVAYTALPAHVELETAGDLIRDAQHMKVNSQDVLTDFLLPLLNFACQMMSKVLEHRYVHAARTLPVVHSEVKAALPRTAPLHALLPHMCSGDEAWNRCAWLSG